MIGLRGLRTLVLLMMGGPERLPLAENLYRVHVGAEIYPLGTVSNTSSTLQVLKHAFELGKTVRPGSPYSVISHAQIEVQGKSIQVVVKTYHKINETTAAKAAQVGQRYPLDVEHRTNSLSAHISRGHGLGLVG